MPDLDVTEVLTDPTFAERLTIKRRVELIGDNGRSSLQVTVITPRPIGVVTSESSERLKREDFGQYRPNTIRVHTRFRLSGPSKDATERQPDVVTWNGDDYVVVQIDNFSQFGRGFMSALCASMSQTDRAPQ